LHARVEKAHKPEVLDEMEGGDQRAEGEQKDGDPAPSAAPRVLSSGVPGRYPRRGSGGKLG